MALLCGPSVRLLRPSSPLSSNGSLALSRLGARGGGSRLGLCRVKSNLRYLSLLSGLRHPLKSGCVSADRTSHPLVQRHSPIEIGELRFAAPLYVGERVPQGSQNGIEPLAGGRCSNTRLRQGVDGGAE